MVVLTMIRGLRLMHPCHNADPNALQHNVHANSLIGLRLRAAPFAAAVDTSVFHAFFSRLQWDTKSPSEPPLQHQTHSLVL